MSRLSSEQRRNSCEFTGWETPRGAPQHAYDRLNHHFGPFSLDLAASPANACCQDFITEREDAFTVDWYKRCLEAHIRQGLPATLRPAAWLNPPYGREGGGVLPWVQEAANQARKGMRIVLLLSNRTDTQWARLARERCSNLVYFNGRIPFWINGAVPLDASGKRKSGNTGGSTAYVFDPFVPAQYARWEWDAA